MNVAELDRSLEMGLKRSVLAVWRHKIIFVLTSAAVFSAVMVSALAIQPVYEGSTLLIGGQVNLEQLPDGSRKPVQSSTSLSRIAESEEVVRQAVEKVGLSNLVDSVQVRTVSIFARMRAALFRTNLEPKRRDVDQIDAALPQVKLGLRVRGEPNSDIIRIAYRHKDPVIAADFSNAVAQAFVDRQIALYGRPGAAEFFMRQRQRFDDELKTASDELERFAITTATYSAEEQRELLLKRLNDLASSLALTRASISDKIGQRQALAESLRKLAPVARSPYVSALVDTLSPDRAPSARVGDSRVLDDRTSDPPLLLVKVYQDSMVGLFKINSDLAGAQSMQKQQVEEMAKLTAELNSLSQNEQQFASLKRAVTQAAFNSDLYAKRMVEEQINAESSAAKFSSVKVLQPATEPLRPVSPNYLIVAAAGVFVSGLVGVGAALLRSQASGRRRQVHAHPRGRGRVLRRGAAMPARGRALGRREVLAAGLALAGPCAGPASAQSAGAVLPVGFSPQSDMRLTFDYVPARDGLALLTGGPTQAGYAATAASRPGLIWEPRFSTEAGPKGGGNAPNGEYQFYADPEHRWSNGFTPFALVGGNLRIRAERADRLGFQSGEIPQDPHTGASYAWVSGVLNSKQRFSQQGGYFEIDAKLPKGWATWPAFWLLPVNERHPPEIDVVEYLGHEPTRYRGTLILPGPTEDATTFDAGVDLSADFHKFGILWTDTAITFYLDGLKTATKSIAGKREFSQRFYVLLNLAIGSRKAQWVPPPSGATPDPADFLVRSVRAWQRLGPSGIALSSSAAFETAKVGATVATMSCSSLDRLGKVTFTLVGDPDGKFRIEGDRLLTRSPLGFLAKRYHDVTIQAADERGRTWRQPFSIAVLDSGAAMNQLAPGSERSLAHGAWAKYGVSVVGGQLGPEGRRDAEFIAEAPVAGVHAVEQLIERADTARRYVVSADLKPQGREWVRFEISRNYGKNVQVFFNVATGEMGDQFASADDAPFILHDCRAVSIGAGFTRCQVDLTADSGPTLRAALKIVTGGSDYGPHGGDPARGVVCRSPIRVVGVG